MSNLSNMHRYSIRLTHEIMSDLTRITFGADMRKAWLILSALQYTWRDPNLSPDMRQAIRAIGDSVAKPILDRHPNAKVLVNAGWSVIMDVGKGEGISREEFRQAMQDMGLVYDEREDNDDGR